jgi:hypothetical protein
MMEFEDIERILELVRQHDLAEFEVEQDGLKLRIRKASAALPPRRPPRRTLTRRSSRRCSCPPPRPRMRTPSSSRS